MKPDTSPGFASHNDYYEVFASSLDEDPPDPINVSDYGAFVEFDSGVDGLLHISDMSWKGPIGLDDDRIDFGSPGGRIVPDEAMSEMDESSSELEAALSLAGSIADNMVSAQGRPVVAHPSAVEVEFDLRDTHVRYFPGICTTVSHYPIFVQSALSHEWTMAPIFSEATSSVVMTNSPGELYLVDLYNEMHEPDLSLTRFAAKNPARISDALKFADAIRQGKATYPNNANRAAYLYLLAGDLENARRTAHYMVSDAYLSFDLALAAASSIRWERDEIGQWVAYANLPEVREAQQQNNDRPAFAYAGFAARSDIRLNVPFPTYKQGWEMLQVLDFETLPKPLRNIARQVQGTNITVFPDGIMELFQETFNYTTTDFGESDEQAPDLHPWN